MSKGREKPRVGELRPSQMLTTFGVGSVVDLPHISVMVMGLEDWPNSDYRELTEERLLASIRTILGDQVHALRSPPIVPDTDRSNPFEEQSYVGVPVAPFPRWMLCPRCRRLAPLSSNQFILKPDAYRPDRVKYVHENCRYPGKLPTVVPARFIVACKNGHLDDFPWVHFVHGGPPDHPYKLQLLEVGPSGEAADIYVRCETCDTSRPMSDAFKLHDSDLPSCRGRRPHLRDFDENGCKDEQNQPIRVRAMTQGASNTWFPILLSALSIPQSSNLLKQLVTDRWSDLYDIEGEGDIAKLRRRNLLRDFSDYPDADLWAAIQERQAGGEAATSDDVTDLKTPEWEIFVDPDHAQKTKDFRLREVRAPRRFAGYFEKVVLVERVREVRALVGFTRIESPGDYESPADFPEAQRMKIARGKTVVGPGQRDPGRGDLLPVLRVGGPGLGGPSPAAQPGVLRRPQAVAEEPWAEPARGVLPRFEVRAAALVRPRPDPPAFAGVRVHGGLAAGADLLPQSGHGPPRDGGGPALHGGTRQRGHARRAWCRWGSRRSWSVT